MNLKRIAAALLAAVMAFSLSACASEDVKWIATQNGENIPAGIYLSYMFDAYYEAVSLATDQEGDNVLKKTVEGVPGSDWILAKTDELFRRHIAIEQDFASQGLTVDSAELGSLDQQIQSQWQYTGEVYQKNGISLDSYKTVMHNAYKENQLFLAQYGKEGKTPVPEAEVRAGFESGYYKLLTTSESILAADGSDMNEADKKVVTDKLQALADAANVEGANFQEIILNYEKEKARAEGKDESTVHAHEANTHVSFVPADTTSYPEDFMKALSEMKPGETRVLTANNVAYAIQKMDIAAVPADLDNYYNTILYKMKKDEFEESLKAMAANVTVQYNENAKKLYVPSKLEFKA